MPDGSIAVGAGTAGGDPPAAPAAAAADPYNIGAALKAGYSTTEIADYLGSHGYGLNIEGARDAGYSDDEIINHLAPQPEPAPPAPEPSSTLGGWAKAAAQLPTTIAGGLINAGGTVLRAAGTGLQALEPADGPKPAPDADVSWGSEGLKRAGESLMSGGQAITDYGRAAVPLTDEEQQRIGVRGIELVGSLAPYLVASLGGPEMVAGLAGLQGFGATYDAAKQAGASDQKAAISALFGGISNAALMMVPIGKAMDIAGKLPGLLMKGAFLKAVGEVAKSSATGVTFTQLQTVADNVIAKETYAPDRPITQDVGKDVGLQAGVFALLPAAGMAVNAGARLLGGGARDGGPLPARPNVQPRPPDIGDVLNAQDVDTAIDAAAQVASAGTPIDARAEIENLSTGDSADLQQAALLRLFNNIGAGTVEQTADGGYQFRTTNAAGTEITHPIEVWNPDPDHPDASTISTDTADALRAHYGQAGVDVVFYRDDNRTIPFEGAADPNQPDTIFLSSNPSKNIAQVAGHEFTHVLATTTLPDGTSLNDLLHQQIAAGITPAGQHYAQATFGATAPKRAGFAPGPDGDAAHADALQAHLINELGADIGGEAPKFQSFLPRVINAVQQRFGDSVAGDMLGKLLDGLKSAMETIRGLFGDTGTRSQNWITNIGEVHDTLAQMYAARFGTPVEREQAALAAMKDKAERDRFVAAGTTPAPPADKTADTSATPAAPPVLAEGQTVTSPHGNGVIASEAIMDQGTPGHLIQLPDGSQHFVHDERLQPVTAPSSGSGDTSGPARQAAALAGFMHRYPDNPTALRNPYARGFMDQFGGQHPIGAGDKSQAAQAAYAAGREDAIAWRGTPARSDRVANPVIPEPEAPATSATPDKWGDTRDALEAKALQLRRWLDELATERNAQAANTPQARLLKQTEAAIVRPVEGDETKLLEGPKARLDQVRGQIDAVTHPAADTPQMAKVRDELATTATAAAVEAAPVAPVEHPIFGNFDGRYVDAVRALHARQGGIAEQALSYPGIGPIDLVWGEAGTRRSDGYGLSKLLAWHPEVVADLPQRLQAMQVTSRSANRVRLAGDGGRAVVRLDWDGQTRHWLLTAFDEKAPRRTERSTDSLDAVLAGRLAPQPARGTTDVGAGETGNKPTEHQQFSL